MYYYSQCILLPSPVILYISLISTHKVRNWQPGVLQRHGQPSSISTEPGITLNRALCISRKAAGRHSHSTVVTGEFRKTRQVAAKKGHSLPSGGGGVSKKSKATAKNPIGIFCLHPLECSWKGTAETEQGILKSPRRK